MDVQITIIAPRWWTAVPDPLPLLHAAADRGTKDHLLPALQAAAPGGSGGGIARGFVRVPGALVADRAVTVRTVNAHPGARPLDQGAQWAGKQPPSGPGSALAAWAAARGLNPYLVARALKYGSRTTGRAPGLPARHYVVAALAVARADIQAVIAREGVTAWLTALR